VYRKGERRGRGRGREGKQRGGEGKRMEVGGERRKGKGETRHTNRTLLPAPLLAISSA